jgi:hypothetical protein
VDNLSENVKRGMRQKIRRGEYPHKPPIGYLNEPRLRTIVLDPQRAPLVRKMFEEYATGSHTFDQLCELVNSWGLTTHKRKPVHRSMIPKLLADPFFNGMFRFAGETHEGKHERFISADLFDRVQIVLRKRGRGHYTPKREPLAFLSLIHCAECGGSITAERQKGHHYYRCTKKLGPCSQKAYIREEALAEQLKAEIRRVALSDTNAENMLAQVEAWRRQAQDTTHEAMQRQKDRLAELETKQSRLLDLYLEGTLSKEDYATRNAEFLREKSALKDKLADVEKKGNCWLEPLTDFIKQANQADKLLVSGNLFEIRDFLRKVGSNLVLSAPKTDREEEERTSRPPSEGEASASEKEPRRGGVAARAESSSLKIPDDLAGKSPDSLAFARRRAASARVTSRASRPAMTSTRRVLPVVRVAFARP